MPMTKIYLRRGTTPEYKRALSDAVHQALVEVLGIPEDDRFHFFHELADENLITEPVSFGLERRRQAIFVQLCFGPRPVEVLNELFAELVANLTDGTGLEPRDIALNVVESPSVNWWVEGRVLNPETGFDERIAADKVPG
ncbi:tautomerase family protein [Amycolatopsis saalfeldensis]|uniref:Phenylpyruvate tautomerase PptA, 4-oxalocrotonate tautomerase family n=1 Tax=Amycolatopsis saalfeldensis TaxID=394193 RepID=A0A1H8Y9G9_9PSEU|nr:tautomerase family protein [Amycolatopsis saalfeldensis]SEP48930.1 Phenylpyruvate tautomerase PptA, 4-oxalocrotonate tautomerase family [Amycolatopsis saalfeldensis]